MATDTAMKLIEQKQLKHASVFLVAEAPNVAIVQANSSYIPIEQFKEIFNYLKTLIADKKITKLVFDKRKLSVFHQPSMEWYFVIWKEEMFDLGLKSHRKILPADEVFRQSVKIGRDKINKTYPNGKFHQMDITYAETLEEAILN